MQIHHIFKIIFLLLLTSWPSWTYHWWTGGSTHAQQPTKLERWSSSDETKQSKTISVKPNQSKQNNPNQTKQSQSNQIRPNQTISAQQNNLNQTRRKLANWVDNEMYTRCLQTSLSQWRQQRWQESTKVPILTRNPIRSRIQNSWDGSWQAIVPFEFLWWVNHIQVRLPRAIFRWQRLLSFWPVLFFFSSFFFSFTCFSKGPQMTLNWSQI